MSYLRKMSQNYLTLSEEKETTQIEQKPLNGPPIPAGLEFLYSACRQLYPDQPNPLQVTAVVKYW